MLFAPIHEGGIRKNRDLNIPPNLRLEPESRITAGYTASNSYLNPGLLVCEDQERGCRLSYETDHTGNLLYASLSYAVSSRWEIGFGIGRYRMEEIPSWALLQRLASDSALRWFHEDVLAKDSLATLSQAPDGRQVFALTDFDGRSLTLEPGQSYLLPLRVDLTRYFDIRRTSQVSMGLNTGIHLAYPLEGGRGTGVGATALARSLDLGVSVNFVRSRRLTPNLTSTFHVQLARFRTDAHVLHPDSPLNADDTHRSQYALTYGLRFGDTFGGRAPCSFALSQISASAQYDMQTYWAWDPQVFAGGNNVRGALTGANDYGVLSFACEHRAQQFQISLVEDIGGVSELFDDDGAGTSYDPDFAISVSLSWNYGKPRAGPE